MLSQWTNHLAISLHCSLHKVMMGDNGWHYRGSERRTNFIQMSTGKTFIPQTIRKHKLFIVRFWWPSLRKHSVQFVQAYHICARSAPPDTYPLSCSNLLQFLIIPGLIFQLILWKSVKTPPFWDNVTSPLPSLRSNELPSSHKCMKKMNAYRSHPASFLEKKVVISHIYRLCYRHFLRTDSTLLSLPADDHCFRELLREEYQSLRVRVWKRESDAICLLRIVCQSAITVCNQLSNA